MSLDYGDQLGCFTELEIASGIPNLVFGPNDVLTDEEYEQLEQKKIERKIELLRLNEKYTEERKCFLKKAISHLGSVPDIKAFTIRELTTEEIKNLITRFGTKESVPTPYLQCLKDRNLIPSMIKSFLINVLDIYPSDQLISEINQLNDRLIFNRELETAYNRVSEIQKYIHNKARFVLGYNGHQNLPRNDVRLLLACSRVNLSILDLFSPKQRKIPRSIFSQRGYIGPLRYYSYILYKTLYQSKIESSYPSVKGVINGEYKSYWNVRFMKPISYYCSSNQRKKIENILSIDDSESISETITQCLKIYSSEL